MREGAIGRRNADRARGDGRIERGSAGQRVVAGCLQQHAVVAALEVGPAEVGAGTAGVDLLVGVPAGVGDDQPAIAVESDRVGVPEAELIDLGPVRGERDALRHEWIVGEALAGARVDAEDLAGQAVERLHARGAGICEVVRGAVADRHIERAVGSEGQGAARVRARVELDVVVDIAAARGAARLGLTEIRRAVDGARAADARERGAGLAENDRLAAGDDRAIAARRVEREAHELRIAVAATVGACVARLAGRVRRIDHIEGVDVRRRGEIRMDDDVQQAAILEVVHLRRQVDHGRQRRAGGEIDQLDGSALLRDVGVVRACRLGRKVDEFHVHRLIEPAGDHLLCHCIGRRQRRVGRISDRVLVVENVDTDRARCLQEAAFDIRNREHDRLGRLAQRVVEDLDRDEQAILPRRKRHRADPADEVLPGRRLVAGDRVLHGGSGRKIARAQDRHQGLAARLRNADLGFTEEDSAGHGMPFRVWRINGRLARAQLDDP